MPYQYFTFVPNLYYVGHPITNFPKISWYTSTNFGENKRCWPIGNQKLNAFVQVDHSQVVAIDCRPPPHIVRQTLDLSAAHNHACIAMHCKASLASGWFSSTSSHVWVQTLVFADGGKLLHLATFKLFPIVNTGQQGLTPCSHLRFGTPICGVS